MDTRLELCMTCQYRKSDFKQGTYCGITNKKPNFIGDCESFEEDPEGVKKVQDRKRRQAEATGKIDVQAEIDAGSRGIGTIFAGIGMIVGAIIWFVVGLAAGRIFFYPPVLFVLGIISLVKGIQIAKAYNNRKQQTDILDN